MTENELIEEVKEPIKNGQFYPPEKIEEQKKGKKFKCLNLVAWVFVLLALYVLFNDMMWHESLSTVKRYAGIFMLGVACVFLSMYIHIFIHELGHVGAGFLVKKKPVLVSVGRWRYELTLRGFRFRKGGRVAGVSGVAVMVDDITRQTSSYRLRTAVYMFGGAFANMMVGVLVLMLTHYGVDHKLVAIALNIFAITGILLGLSNLAPLKMQGWETDGLQIWKALRGQGNVVDAKSTYLASSTYCGVSAKDWPAEKVPTVDEIEAEGVLIPSKMSAYVVRFEYAFATHRVDIVEESAHWLAKHFNTMPDGVTQQVAFLQCVFAVLTLKDSALFQAWRPQCAGGLFNLGPRLHWIDAEHAFMVGDKVQARLLIEKATNTLLDLPMMHTKESIEERLNLLSDQLREQV